MPCRSIYTLEAFFTACRLKTKTLQWIVEDLVWQTDRKQRMIMKWEKKLRWFCLINPMCVFKSPIVFRCSVSGLMEVGEPGCRSLWRSLNLGSVLQISDQFPWTLLPSICSDGDSLETASPRCYRHQNPGEFTRQSLKTAGRLWRSVTLKLSFFQSSCLFRLHGHLLSQLRDERSCQAAEQAQLRFFGQPSSASYADAADDTAFPLTAVKWSLWPLGCFSPLVSKVWCILLPENPVWLSVCKLRSLS